MRKGLIFVLVHFLLSSAFGISRVGNSLMGSPKSGFTTVIPHPFENIVSVRAETLRLNLTIVDPEVDSSHGMMQSFIETNDLDLQQPNLHFKNQEQARDWFVSRGWKEVAAPDSCVLAFRITTQGTANLVMTWGQDRGADFYGFDRSLVRNAFNEIIKGIRLEPGACQW